MILGDRALEEIAHKHSIPTSALADLKAWKNSHVNSALVNVLTELKKLVKRYSATYLSINRSEKRYIYAVPSFEITVRLRDALAKKGEHGSAERN